MDRESSPRASPPRHRCGRAAGLPWPWGPFHSMSRPTRLLWGGRIRRTAGYRPPCIRRLSAAPPCALLPACNFLRTASYWSRRVPCTTLGTSPGPAGFRRSRVRRGSQRARSRLEIGAIYGLLGRRDRLRLIRGDRQDRFREHGTKASPALLGTQRFRRHRQGDKPGRLIFRAIISRRPRSWNAATCLENPAPLINPLRGTRVLEEAFADK